MPPLRPVLAFVLAHVAWWGLVVWVGSNFDRLLARTGGHLSNLPLAVHGPLLLSRWLVEQWPILLGLLILLTALYVLLLRAPAGQRPRPGVLVLCWLPLVFAYGLLLWMTFAQRVPLEILQRRMGGEKIEVPAQGSPP